MLRIVKIVMAIHGINILAGIHVLGEFRCQPPSITPDEFSKIVFDYIVVGKCVEYLANRSNMNRFLQDLAPVAYPLPLGTLELQ